MRKRKLVRKFNHKLYRKIASFVTEDEANQIASNKRKKGFSVRTIPRCEGRLTRAPDIDYDVYARKKRGS